MQHKITTFLISHSIEQTEKIFWKLSTGFSLFSFVSYLKQKTQFVALEFVDTVLFQCCWTLRERISTKSTYLRPCQFTSWQNWNYLSLQYFHSAIRWLTHFSTRTCKECCSAVEVKPVRRVSPLYCIYKNEWNLAVKMQWE